MKKSYEGSCHCGAVRFECQLDLAEGTSKCNCSICTKARFWKAIAVPNSFKLLQGEDSLTEYQFGSGNIHHFFCKRCGVKPFGRGFMEELGGTFYAIALGVLDSASPEELAAAPVKYEDGRHERWEREPAETRHL